MPSFPNGFQTNLTLVNLSLPASGLLIKATEPSPYHPSRASAFLPIRSAAQPC
jgi:hypothetical protein